MEQIAFVIDGRDNVATALAPLTPGTVRLTGDAPFSVLEATQDIPDGHKVALRPIQSGEPIVKYGVVIGAATQDIAPGTWVHLHCMRSLVDQRSSHLDIHTGAPCDMEYE
ncbi:MAG: UxaA family hydrolase [Lawsonibacter sp.]